jgi:2-keto-4-pentenoate hydratase
VVDQRLVSALAKQLERRQAALRRGARHIGWKLGTGERESIGGEIAVGFLTSETMLPAAGSYRSAGRAELHADAEAVVELDRELDPSKDATAALQAIGRYGAALEIVDLARLPDEPQSVVIGNVFHQAVAFADSEFADPGELTVSLLVNGQLRAVGAWPRDLADRITRAAHLLAAVDERLRAGDRIITGSIVQVPVKASDRVVAHFGDVAALRLDIAE